MSFYAADLARMHDEGFGDFPRASACELHRRLPPTGRVVELGCGTGITTEILTGLGYDVFGVDISADMLAIARRRAPAAELHHRSAWDTEIPPCVGVTAIGEIINYATDEKAGSERLPALLARIHEALAPGGVFLFDFATPGRGAPPRVHEGDGWRIVSENVELGDGDLERRMIIESDGQTREEIHRLHLYERDLVAGFLEDAGFVSEELEQYCDFRWGRGYAAFAASAL